MDPQSADAFHRLEQVRAEIESLIALRASGPLLSGQQRRYESLVRLERDLLQRVHDGPERLGEVATP